MVDGDVVGPADANLDDRGPVAAVHAGHLDARVIAPVRVHDPAARKFQNRSA